MRDIYHQVDFRRGFLAACEALEVQVHELNNRVVGPLTAKAWREEMLATLAKMKEKHDG